MLPPGRIVFFSGVLCNVLVLHGRLDVVFGMQPRWTSCVVRPLFANCCVFVAAGLSIRRLNMYLISIAMMLEPGAIGDWGLARLT